MITLAQRLEQLRMKKGISRQALAAALGFPRMSIEKFETGRQTPSAEQQRQLAHYFGVDVLYLRGEEQGESDWMMDDIIPSPIAVPTAKRPAARREPEPSESGGGENLADAFLRSPKFQEALRTAVLEVLRSEEGRKLLAKAQR